MDPQVVRTALIITLSILLAFLLFRRFRRAVQRKDVPVPSHAELLSVELAYHPARLRVLLSVPGQQPVRTALLDAEHHVLHQWEEDGLEKGRHMVERELPPLADGRYYLEMRTATQRTVRQFILRQA